VSIIEKLYKDFGQSIWLDYIDRNLLIRGGLQDLVDVGIRGVTVNPTIFHKAVTSSTDYDESIQDLLLADRDMDEQVIYEWLIIDDVKKAADILEPVYTSSKGTDGFVSLEVSPHIAYDTNASIDSARHLWNAVGRPNLMIKIPGTVPGLLAIEQLIADGINVNVTLLFSVERYKAVTEAFIKGLSNNPNPKKVASVASFFVSRVDSKVDAVLENIGTDEARSLKGKIAIANTKVAYQHFKETMNSPALKAELLRGAKPQRPLWASTSTKDPAYSDVLYVEQLIGTNTVNTVPPVTLDAVQAHGELFATLEREVDAAQRYLNRLDDLEIDLARITQDLEQEGVKKFADSYDQLLLALREKRDALLK